MMFDFSVVRLKGYFLSRTMNCFTSFLIIKKKRKGSNLTSRLLTSVLDEARSWGTALFFGQMSRPVAVHLLPWALSLQKKPRHHGFNSCRAHHRSSRPGFGFNVLWWALGCWTFPKVFSQPCLRNLIEVCPSMSTGKCFRIVGESIQIQR